MVEYIRAKTNGVVLEWNELLVGHPDWEPVTEQEAFPEKFAPVDLKTRDKKLDLTIPEEAVIALPDTPIELASQKGRIFNHVSEAVVPKTRTKAADVKAPVLDIAGLKGDF